MKIDPHVHTSGISLCSRIDYADMVDKKRKAGYDAVVLTNHCQPWYFKSEGLTEWSQNFITEYERAKSYGSKNGIKVFLGIEVSVKVPHWSDFLIYGIDKDFILNPTTPLCELTQEQLYRYCESCGALMIQAHPYRDGHHPADINFMHGVEINLRPFDYIKRPLVEELADKNNLFITCGSDYHGAEMLEFGGMILPDEVTDSISMAKHLKERGESTLFFENEVVTYKRK